MSPHDLTPSEVALAKILAAWDEWPMLGARAYVESGAKTMCAVGDALYGAGLARGMGLSDKGRDLLDRARKAGVFGVAPEDRDDSEDVFWATRERPPDRLDDVTPEDVGS